MAGPRVKTGQLAHRETAGPRRLLSRSDYKESSKEAVNEARRLTQRVINAMTGPLWQGHSYYRNPLQDMKPEITAEFKALFQKWVIKMNLQYDVDVLHAKREEEK